MKIVPQRAQGDCGVSALATLLGATYEDVYVAAATVDVHRGKRGLGVAHLTAVARVLGVKLRHKRRVDLDEDEGLLSVLWNDERRFGGHFVVLYNGMVIDPAGPQVLSHEEWFRQNDARPATLLVEAS